MKTLKGIKKIHLNKSTIATLDNPAKAAVKGGYLNTKLYGNCNTWHPICPTRYIYICTCQVCSDSCAAID